MIVVVDRREKLPYSFSCSVTGTLASGDYSVFGRESEVAVERKTKSDLYRSLGVARARFKAEMERLAQYRYAAVVVEATLRDLLHPPPFTKLKGSAAVTRLLSWAVEYRVAVFFAGGRANGNATTRVLLTAFWRMTRGEGRPGHLYIPASVDGETAGAILTDGATS